MSAQTNGSGQVYCTNCGASIDAAARFCPECGEEQESPRATRQRGGGHDQRQAQSNPTRSRSSGGGSRGRHDQNQDVGFIFAFVDSWQRQKTIRRLLNIVLIFVSFGTYLGLLLVEGLVHYHNLKTGKSVPYREHEHQKVWTTLGSVN
ncbi:MAG: zinc ribbon domain-containing protein [Halanaeroarchaeum sp.]